MGLRLFPHSCWLSALDLDLGCSLDFFALFTSASKQGSSLSHPPSGLFCLLRGGGQVLTGYQPTCMSEQEVVSLKNQVRDLQDRVALLEKKLEALLSSRGQDGDDWSVVSTVPSGARDSAGSSGTQGYNQLALEIPDCCPEGLRLCEALRGGRLSNRERAQRAWSAGFWARFVLQGRVAKPRPTLPIDLSNSVYVVLRAPGISGPVLCLKASDYRALVGDFTNPTLSHGFPSKAEARTYCLGADVNFPSSVYRILWPPDPTIADPQPGLCIVVMTRKAAGGGLLLALPEVLIPPGTLDPYVVEDPEGIIGPFLRVEVPGVREEEEERIPLGFDLPLWLIDVSAEILTVLVPLSQVPAEEEGSLIGFGEDANVIPDPDRLMAVALDFVAGSSAQRAIFYSADEGEEEVVPPSSPKALPKGKAKDGAKPKRVTTAGLADQLASLMEMIPQMFMRMDSIREEQVAMRREFEEKRSLRPSQAPVSTLPAFAKMMGSPPRVKHSAPALAPQKSSPLTFGLDSQISFQEQAEEKSPKAEDPMAQAVLEQSKALMTLVAHLQQGGDPLLDGQVPSSSSSLGTRGSVGRERLQKELATRSGSFFLAVLQNAVRRLKPASRLPASVEEVASTDFSMIQYLERFGGYGAFKELGLIQYALAHICDALVHSDLQGAQEHLALLMVGVEQANLDGNRWDLAYRLMLLEEPPSQLWSYRSSGYDPKAKAFAPLCPQKWTTVALAYSKEIDYINTRRQEVVAAKPGSAASSSTVPGPKKKGRFPKAKANAQPSQESSQ